MIAITCERCGTDLETAGAGQILCPGCRHLIEVLVDQPDVPAIAEPVRRIRRIWRRMFWAVAICLIGVGALVLYEVRRFDTALGDPTSDEDANDRRRARTGMFELLSLDGKIVDWRRMELKSSGGEWLWQYASSNRIKAESARGRLASDMALRFPKVSWPTEPPVGEFTSVPVMELWWANQRGRYEIPKTLVTLR